MRKYGFASSEKLSVKRITPENVFDEGVCSEDIFKRSETLKPYEIKVLEISK
jgi:hypothetical protein